MADVLHISQGRSKVMNHALLETRFPELPTATRFGAIQHGLDLLVRFAPFGWKLSAHSVLFRNDLAAGSALTSDDRFQVGWATEDDMASIAAHPEGYGHEPYDRYRQRGASCFCLKIDGEIASYNWVVFDKCCLLCGFLSGVEFLPLAQNQAYTFDLYTYTKFRSAGIGTALKRALHAALTLRGIKQVYALVAPDRLPSMRIQLRLGAEAERVLYAFRLRQLAGVFLGPKNDPRLQSWILKYKTAMNIT